MRSKREGVRSGRLVHLQGILFSEIGAKKNQDGDRSSPAYVALKERGGRLVPAVPVIGHGHWQGKGTWEGSLRGPEKRLLAGLAG